MNAYDLNNKVLEFNRLLRREGMNVNQSHSLKTMSVLQQIDLLDKDAFYYALRSILCFSPEDYRRFDRVFRGFWGEQLPFAGEEQPIEDDEEDENDPSDDDAESSVQEFEQTGQSITGDQENDQLVVNKDLDPNLDRANKIYTYSADEKLMMKEFMTIAMDDVMSFQRNWAPFLMLLKRSMRNDPVTKGHKQIHFRRTMRKNLSHGGGEWFHLYKKGQSPSEKQMLFTLADISGSMETYTKEYLPVLYLLHRYMVRSETFFFNTNLYSVTKHFRHRYGKMMELINDRLRMISNGTNLAQCLHLFRKRYSTQLSPRLSSVVIFSDGWDRGDLEQLESEIKLLHKQVFQIIWINPLLGTKGYEPRTQALDVVSPYLAHMVSAHDYRSLSGKKQMKWSVK